MRALCEIMSTVKYILKVFGTHILAIMLMFFLMIGLTLILADEIWYQWLITAIFLAFYWSFMGISVQKYATEDVKNKKFTMLKPILAAAVLSIPSIVIIIVKPILSATPEEEHFFDLLYKLWNIGYLNLFSLTNNSIFAVLLPIIALFPGLCFCYYRGILIKKRTDEIIAQSKDEAGVRKAAKEDEEKKMQFRIGSYGIDKDDKNE